MKLYSKVKIILPKLNNKKFFLYINQLYKMWLKKVWKNIPKGKNIKILLITLFGNKIIKTIITKIKITIINIEFKILNTNRFVRFSLFVANGISKSYLNVNEIAHNWIMATYIAYKLNSYGL